METTSGVTTLEKTETPDYLVETLREFERFRDQFVIAIQRNAEHAIDGRYSHDIESLRAEIAAGRLQLWTGPHSAIVTEVIQYPMKRVLSFLTVCGSLSAAEFYAMYPIILEWGKSRGCTTARYIGRKAWSRVFQRDTRPWVQTAVQLEREL